MLVEHLQGQEQHSTANATAISTLPCVEGPLAEGVPLSQKFILAVIIHLVLFHPVTVDSGDMENISPFSAYCSYWCWHQWPTAPGMGEDECKAARQSKVL